MARLAPRVVVLAASAAVVVALAPVGARADSPATCAANVSIPPSIRAESHTDVVGDIILSCSGGAPTPFLSAVPTHTLTVFLNTPVTSRLLAAPWGEPLLLIGEPAPNDQLACQAADGNCTLMGVGDGTDQYDGSAGHPNVFQGQVSGSQVTFANVPLDASSGGRILRITNIRTDAPVIAGSGVTSVIAAISFGSSPTVTNPTPTVGFISSALAYSARTPDGVAGLSSPTAVRACGTQQVATLRYSETIPIGWKPRVAAGNSGDQDVPGTLYSSESNFFNTQLVGDAARGNLGIAGLADFGTRMKAVFDHVPAGASVFVPTAVTGAHNEQLQLVAGETAPYSPVVPSGAGPAGTAPVPITGGSGTAVWEDVKSNPNSNDSADIPVYVSSGPGSGTATVSGGYGPNVVGATVPSFVGPPAPTSLATVAPCPVAASGAPRLSAVSVSNKRFRVAKRATPVLAKKKSRKVPLGTEFRFTLSASADVRIAIKRRAAGLRSGKRCVKPNAKLRRKHAKSCKRFVAVGTLVRANRTQGANKVAFTGRIGRRALRPRAYRAVMSASNAAGHKTATLTFTVVR